MAEAQTEPEQQQIDANRQAALRREREPGGSEKIDAQLAQQNAQRQEYERTGNFWLKRKDTQEHISDEFVGKAAAVAAAQDLLKQQPDLRGNIVITAYGPGETQGVAEGFKNMYAEFSGYGNYMQGRAVNVFNKAGLEIVSKDYTEDDDIQTYVVKGDRQAIEKAGEFLERNPEQFGGYHFVKQGVAEGGYPEVDHMPGPTIKRTQTGCKRCHGKGYVYKTPDGEVHPMNRPDAKKYKCGKCDGIGFVKVAEQGVAEGSQDNGISFRVQKGKNKFVTTMTVNNEQVGVYQYDATTGRSIAEVYPEFKGKGFGKLLVLHAIYTAAKLGLDFQEDESRTAEYDNVLDSLSSNSYIVDDDGYWYVTGEGEQYLQQSLKQGVAEGKRMKTASGMYRDQHTGVAYRGKTGQDGNDSYMTPDYLIQKYQERLAQIASGPYKRPKEVAQLKSRIAKLQGQQGVAEGAPIVVAQAPIHIRNPKKQQSRQDKPLTAYQQGVAAQGKPYKNPHPFDPKAGADVNYDHNQYRAGYKKQGVAEGSLEEIDRRGFLKGMGAAAVAGTGLSPMPAKAWFFFIIPLPNTNPDAAANACMPPTVQVGQQVNFQNELQVIQKIHGVSNRCQNPNMPVAVTIGKPEPVQAPVVKEPPNQKTPPNYASRIIARIRPNIHYSGDTSGNPRAEIEVRVSSDGTITGVKLEKSSGNSEWDQAVIDAVKKTQTMPLDSTGNVPSIMIMGFRPMDNQSLQRESVDQGVAEGGEKDRQWSNKDMERLRVATRDFDDIMASDGPDQTKHDLIKKRIQTKPMAGPKGVLPEEGVAEGGYSGIDDTDTVGFSVNSERAYNAVMARFGDQIDHDETSGILYVPARLWPKVEMVAFDADGEGATQTDGLDEGEKVGNMDADAFDAAMARLKKLAGAGPMKTVYDPNKRVYRNVPTAVQPGTKK
jgi:TonB family protein